MAARRQKSPDGSAVVIVGGGIIGLSTAYYVSTTRKCARSITIVDNASILYAGASGKANGILGDYGFKPEAEPLGKLSWELHRKLASQHRGRAAWGFRDVLEHKLHCAASSDAPEVALTSTHPPSPLPTWCRHLEDHASVSTSNSEHAARVSVKIPLSVGFLWLIICSTPMDFCKFLQTSCEEAGIGIHLDTTITGVGINQGSLESVTIAHNKKREKRTIECHSLVIAAGPWSETALSGLFPNSRIRIPSSKQPSSGNYLVVKVPRWNCTQDTRICHQIHLEGNSGHKVDISSRPDGTLYIGGSLSAQEELPERTTDVQPQSRYVCQMKRLVESVLGCAADDMQILEEGRAYRPCLEHGRPIIAQVPLDELLGVTHRDANKRKEVQRGGVYLNVGHGRDGITLGPGSGLVMSELIEQGRSTSADISGLGVL